MNMSYKIDMCHGPILPGMIRFSLPLALTSLLQLLFNAADVIVIGQFSTSISLAAVGADGLVVGLFANILLNLAIGATVFSSKYLGAGQQNRIKGMVQTSAALSIICGLFFMILMYVIGAPFLRLLNTPEEVMPRALQYLYYYLPGLPGTAVYNFGAALLRAKGDTKRPFIFLTAAGIANVFLNLFFVIVFHMDVAGVALATAITQYMAAILIVICLIREKDEFHLDIHNIHIDTSALENILHSGIPAAFQCFVFYVSNFVIQSAINSFGPVVMAGNAAASNIEQFAWVCMSSFSQAGMTYISQNLGAQNYKRIDQANRTALLCMLVTGLILGNAVAIFGGQLLHIYTPDADAAASGLIRLRIICTTYITCGFMDTLSASIRGLGYFVLPSIVTTIGACFSRIIWIFTIFQIPRFHTQECLFLAYPISWILTAAVHAVCYTAIRKKLPRN